MTQDPAVDVLLLDGYNLLYRAFTSLPQAIVSRDGRPINAVYGAVSAVIGLFRDLDTERAVFALDTPDVPTFRHRLYPDYQGQRGPLGGEQSEEFARQVEISKQVFPALGIPAVAVPGYEADDVMGTLAHQNSQSGRRAVVVSTDRDLLQLVRPGISVLVPGTPPRLFQTDADVRARLGVGPAGVTTWKALAGDASDNVPGLRGIGTKTAADLVNRFASLEAIYAALESLSPKTVRLLTGQEATARLYRDVVTVRTDLDLPPTLASIQPSMLANGMKVREALDIAGYGKP